MVFGVLIATLGCRPSSDAEAGPGGEIDGAASMMACGGRRTLSQSEVVRSNSGNRFEVVDWEHLRVGDNRWDVKFSDAEGRGLELAPEQIDVVLFMPDHGHGTAVAVGIESLGAGHYRLAPVNLRMPGYWQISVSVNANADAGTDLFQFAVCVA